MLSIKAHYNSNAHDRALRGLTGRNDAATMLSLSQIQSFVTIVDEGSFQLAAARLNCSQPSISQKLRRLEELLGVQLIMRDRACSTPTRDGEAFLPHARSLLKSASRAEERLKSRALVVAASSNIGVYLLPRLIKSFSGAESPQITVRIASNRAAIDALLSGEADIALAEWTEEHQGYEWQSWRREKLVTIVAPTHALAGRRRVGRTRLLKETFIGGEPGTGTGRILRDFFGDQFVNLKVGMELGSTAAVKEAVKAELGISIVLSSCVADDLAHGTLVALNFEEADLYKSLQALLPRETPDSAAARRFLAHINTDAGCASAC